MFRCVIHEAAENLNAIANGVSYGFQGAVNGVSYAAQSVAGGVSHGVQGAVHGVSYGVHGVVYGVWYGMQSVVYGVSCGVQSLANGVSNGVSGTFNGVSQGLLFVANGVSTGLMILATGVGDLLMSGVFQIAKFAVVLLLVHMMGMGIFYLWERNIQTGGHKNVSGTNQINRISTVRPSTGRPSSSSNNETKYPFVVEIPSKLSVDSLRNSRKSKAKERKSDTGNAGRNEDSDAHETDDEQ